MKAVVAAALIFGCAATAHAGTADDDVARVMEHVRYLSVEIGPRLTESPEAGRAVEYIERHLSDLAVDSERVHVIGVQVQPAIAIGSVELLPERRASHRDPNVVARFGPPTSTDTPAILIMAHYDTVPGSPGAVDNAVACGIALELAAYLAHEQPARPVILAWTAAEEYRTAGARALAEAIGDEVGLALSIDLIGAGGPINLNGLSSLLGISWLRWLRGVAERAGVDVVAPLVHRVISRHAPQVERSDHGVFTQRGIPAFHIYNRRSDGIFLQYHTQRDTMEVVDRRSVIDAMAFVAALVATEEALPASGGDQGLWLDTPAGPIIVPGIAVLVVELGLSAVCILAVLVAWRRRSRAAGVGLIAAIAVYATAWLPVWIANAIAVWATGHPQPWVHAPTRFTLCSAAIAAVFGALGAIVLASRGRPVGMHRYLAAAIASAATCGAALIGVGAPELAWLPLVSAAALAGVLWAPRLPYALGLFAFSLLPVLAVLDPDLLRESVWHGFYPRTLSVTPMLAVVCFPHAMAVVYLLRRWGQPAPRGHLARRIAIAAATVTALVATAIMSVPSPTCDGKSYNWAAISCENGPPTRR